MRRINNAISYIFGYNTPMKPIKLLTSSALSKLATRYVWWNPVTWSYEHPLVFLANVMNLGCWADIQLLRYEVGDSVLKQVLLNAPAGYFNYRSWDYWHAKFDISPVPELPKREL